MKKNKEDKNKIDECQIFGHVPRKTHNGKLAFCLRCGKTDFSIKRENEKETIDD